jgi:hypothetical protein
MSLKEETLLEEAIQEARKGAVLDDADVSVIELTDPDDILSQEKALLVQDARNYLASTDFKMLADYDENTADIKVLRQEARTLIRDS